MEKSEREKKIRITIETDQVMVLRRSRESARMQCAGCQMLVPVVTAQEAAAIANQSLRALCLQVDAGLFHFIETPNGHLYICLDSLLAGTRQAMRPADPAPRLSTSEGEPDL